MSTAARGEGADSARAKAEAESVTEPVEPEPRAATERQGCGSLQRMVRPLVCPFCGCAPKIHGLRYRKITQLPEHWFVRCENRKCHVEVKAHGETHAAAVKKWNRRPNDP